MPTQQPGPRVAALTAADVSAECDRWPLPGQGDTRARWERLVALGRRDLAVAKLVEPHHDAVAILDELGLGELAGDDDVWAVWAAEPPFAVLRASPSAVGWSLTGSKAFCSGASLVTHALVTADTDEGSRLFAVRVGAGISVDASAPPWVGPGMQRAGTVTLAFDDVPAQPVGVAGAYTDRTGFWLGAVGVAACWFGGALGVADMLAAGSERLGPHAMAHLGAVRAGTETFGLALEAAAARADAGLTPAVAQRLALVLRARAAEVVEDTISRVGRATGPGPLAMDEEHARRVADLTVFVRQHHAERDLESLGRLS